MSRNESILNMLYTGFFMGSTLLSDHSIMFSLDCCNKIRNRNHIVALFSRLNNTLCPSIQCTPLHNYYNSSVLSMNSQRQGRNNKRRREQQQHSVWAFFMIAVSSLLPPHHYITPLIRCNNSSVRCVHTFFLEISFGEWRRLLGENVRRAGKHAGKVNQ